MLGGVALCECVCLGSVPLCECVCCVCVCVLACFVTPLQLKVSVKSFTS